MHKYNKLHMANIYAKTYQITKLVISKLFSNGSTDERHNEKILTSGVIVWESSGLGAVEYM